MPPHAVAGRLEESDERERPEHGLRATPVATPAAARTRPTVAEPPPSRPSAHKSEKGEKGGARARSTEHHAGPVSVPVSVVPSEASPLESDIRRLTRIIFSDIVIYGPEKADKAIREGRFAQSYKTEIEEGKKMIRSRFPSDTTAAVETFLRCLDELLDARKKELHSAIAL